MVDMESRRQNTASSYKKFVDLIIEVQKEQSRMMKRKAMEEVELRIMRILKRRYMNVF